MVVLKISTQRLNRSMCARAASSVLKSRHLHDPVLVATDGAPGLIRAIEEVFPRSLRQRCLAHRIRNLEAKVPAELWAELVKTTLRRRLHR